MKNKFDTRCPACGTFSITRMIEGRKLSHRCSKCGYGWLKVNNEILGRPLFA